MFFDGVDAEAAKAIEAAIGILGRMTSGVRDVTLPSIPESSDAPPLLQPYIRVIGPEALAWHEPMLKEHPERYHAGTRTSIEGGARTSTPQYIQARREMDRLRGEIARTFEQVDLLITPAAPGPAFELGSRPGLIWLRNAAVWNLYGLPAISIPCGFTSTGLPLGLQISAAHGRDDLVLALAAAYQQITDWHARRPPEA
jgi:aspartyl-tRNA(Asn)/glutamyl-tRNA(Gln) amidotransferase subunit A